MRRGVVPLLALSTLGLERFAFYGLKGELLVALAARGLDDASAEALRHSMTNSARLVTMLFALIAIAIPRTAIAAFGLTTASVALCICAFGPATAFETGVWLAMAGSGAFHAVGLAMCAEFVSSQRAKVGVVVFALAAMNLGGFGGSFFVESSAHFRAAQVGYALALVISVASFIWLSVRPAQVPPSSPPNFLSAAAIATFTVPLVLMHNAAFDLLQATPLFTQGPLWLISLSSVLVVGGAIALGAILLFARGYRVSTLTLSSWVLGIVLVAVLVAAVVLRRPQSLGEGAALLVLQGIAEPALIAVSMGSFLALASPRFAPLIIAMFGLAGSVGGAVKTLPPMLALGAAGALVLLGAACAIVLFVLRRSLLEPLDRPIDGNSGGAVRPAAPG